MRKIKKIIAIILMITLLLMNFSNYSIASMPINEANMFEIGICDTGLRYHSNIHHAWFDVDCYFTVYEENGVRYPAYCLDPDFDGVGQVGSYYVDIDKVVDDERIWRVISNGYPYKTPQELGVETVEDAYLVTKRSVHAIISNVDVLNQYSTANEHDVIVLNAINNLTNIGRYGIQTRANQYLSINKIGEFYKDGNYYVQKFNVTGNVTISDYTIIATNNMPNGAIITNANGIETNYFNDGESFYVKVPKESMLNNIESVIRVQGRCKIYPIFYGATRIANTQNYALSYDPYGDLVTSTTFNADVYKAGIIINKIDEETGTKLSGVTYNVKYADGTNIGDYTTDSNGKITINDLLPQKIIITEIATKDGYVLDPTPVEVELEYNEIKNIELTNQYKKGSLKIIKVDADNHEYKLSGVEFDLIYPNGDKYHLITDENGVAKLDNINIGIATLIETKTGKEYKLNGEQAVKIEWNKTTNLLIENEKYKSQIEVYKTDAENKEWKLAGVEFEIYNKDMEYLETITTDENGYAITSEIPTGDQNGVLYAKEIKTDEMHILNDDIIKVNVEADVITALNLTNDRIKGQIKVIKTSEDDNFINGTKAGSPIPNVKFEIYDVDKNKVDEIITDMDGIAISKPLDKGIYYIKEIESGKWYLLNEKIFTTEIKENKEIVEVDITNESEKPDVDIEKDGIIQTTANQEIKYDFKIKNTGNVPLDKFTWYDYLPTDYVRITKLITGTYNQDLNYSIYYKTNKNDYRLLMDNLSTNINHYIDFSKIELEQDEYITEFKANFGTVDDGFESVIDPYIFVRVNSDVKNDDIFTNETRIEGYNKTYLVWDEDNHTTKVYEKEINVKKLPRTGF